jgi:hypothetical protein
METEIELDVQPDAVNALFWPYLHSRARYRLFWGGRDSSKSDFVALDLLLQCLTLPYFKCVLVRRYANTIKGSQWDTLKRVAEREGIDHLFTWGINPLGIKCRVNHNSFVPFGMDDMGKAKSLSDPTHAWYEEANQTEEADCDVLSTSLRSSVPGAVFQEIYSFNPDHEGDYKSFWLWKKFFERTGHAGGTTFSGTLAVDVDGRLIELPYEVLHSTARDNRWCPPERIATYKGYEKTDPYRFRVWYEGMWATKQTGNEFYPRFSRAAHTASPVPYVPEAAIWQSWDANSLPYCAMLCAQTTRDAQGRTVLGIFKEYALRSPNGGLKNTAKQFLKDRQRLKMMGSEVWLTGDSTMKNRSTGDENENNKKDVVSTLSMGFKSEDDGERVPGCLHSASDGLWLKKNPGVNRRGDFVNYLLAGGFSDIVLRIDPACAELIADMELTQRGIDGKLKEKFDDKVLGVKYEIRGHFSDILDYLLCTVFKSQWEAFKDGRDG